MAQATVSAQDYLRRATLCPLTYSGYMRSPFNTKGVRQRRDSRSTRGQSQASCSGPREVQLHGHRSNPSLCVSGDYVLIHHDAHIAMQDLLLPATGMKYCSHAGHHIRNIKEMGDMVEDVLKTATAAACVFGYNGDHLPDLTFGTNDAAYLLDRDSSQFCDIRTVAWNDANGSASTTTMVIVCIAPGALTESDWASFCTGRVFPDRLFDYLPMYQESGDSLEGTPVNRKGRKVNRDRWTNWQRVWAITYKACRELYCSRFAVTTYQRWTFGEFKQGMETAVITPFVNASSESPDRPRLLPLLVHHCQLSRGERKANGMIDFHGILCHTCRAEALFSVADLEYHRLHPDQVAEDESLEQK